VDGKRRFLDRESGKEIFGFSIIKVSTRLPITGGRADFAAV
jgi:hypothetical protein